jgi:hypothetical protein
VYRAPPSSIVVPASSLRVAIAILSPWAGSLATSVKAYVEAMKYLFPFVADIRLMPCPLSLYY